MKHILKIIFLSLFAEEVTGWSYEFKTKGLLLKENKGYTSDRNHHKIFRWNHKLYIIELREIED